MGTHIHHIIPRSRGGTDDEWNLVELDPYTHAYNHALDFVLFDQAPMFDCRHEAWPSLPLDLQTAVREKLRVLWNTRQSDQGKKGGAACVERQLGICAPNFGEVVSQNMRNLVSNGEHWFQTEDHRQRVTDQNRLGWEQGTHPLQQPCKCPICGVKLKTKGGLGPHMRKHRNAE